MPRPLAVRRLGLVPYDTALDLQARLVEQRRGGEIPDTLLLLQHPHVVTLGVKVRNDRSHVLARDAELSARGVTVWQSGRGGDVTYHGPGQLVGYPIFDLNPDRRDLHRYVRDLEEALIHTLACFDIPGTRVSGLTGVWVGDAKIAAIGVRIARWVTSHGFALNVSTDLEYFKLIVPCGIADRGVTSIDRLIGRHVPMDEVEAAVIREMAARFDLEAPPGGGPTSGHGAFDRGRS